MNYKRDLKALRNYQRYLLERQNYYRIGLINLNDQEIERINRSLKFYAAAFAANGESFFRFFIGKSGTLPPAIRAWFYEKIEELKNDILRSEVND